MNGGRFDFDDGGTYCGGWEEGKAHGHGVCTGPKGQGEYSGAWHYGFEVSGVYTWPSGNTYEGQWQNGKRHGLGIERRGRWMYRGEWTQGYKGRYGVRHSTNSQAKYEGTWSSGLQDGYGTETYADGGVYQGQWLRGMRHGYGIRRSAPYGVAAKYRSRSHAHASLTSLRSEQGDESIPAQGGSHIAPEREKGGVDESRGGFVLRAHSEPPARRRSLSERSIAVKRTILQGLRITKQRSTGDIHQRVTHAGAGETPRSIRSSGSTTSCTSDESAYTGYSTGHDRVGPAPDEFIEPSTTETYMGEWKNDKRSGFGVVERSDGLKYEGEWFNNKKFGYGVTVLKDGTREEGKYKNNILVTSQRKKHLLFVRSSKLRERIDAAVAAANRAAQIALQKADIGVSRTATARDRAEQADGSSAQAHEDSDVARLHAKQFDPNFLQPGISATRRSDQQTNHVPYTPPMRVNTGAVPPHEAVTPPMLTPPSQPRTPLHAKEDAYTAHPSSLVPGATRPQQLDSFGAPQHQTKYGAQLSAQQPTSFGSQQQTAFGAQPQQQPGYGGPQHQPGYGGPQQQPGYGGPQHQPGHGGPQHQPGHGGPQHQPGYGGPQHQPTYGGPQHQPTYGGPQHQPGHGGPQQQPGYGGPQHQPGYGPPQQAGYGAHERDDINPRQSSPTLPPPPTQRPAQVAFLEDRLEASPSRTASQNSSRHSINQLMNDHFDQYSMVANPSAAKLRAATMQRQQVQHYSVDATSDPSSSSPTTGLIRRSTLSSARDMKGLPVANAPLTALQDSANVAGPSGLAQMISPDGAGLDEARGSLPDLHHLEQTPVVLSRDEVSRLSSQRRQELQRIHEEAELLRSNPLRYLFHPAVRTWVLRWKLPLLVVLVNVCLSVLFYQLLTYHRPDSGD